MQDMEDDVFEDKKRGRGKGVKLGEAFRDGFSNLCIFNEVCKWELKFSSSSCFLFFFFQILIRVIPWELCNFCFNWRMKMSVQNCFFAPHMPKESKSLLHSITIMQWECFLDSLGTLKPNLNHFLRLYLNSDQCFTTTTKPTFIWWLLIFLIIIV